jgi:DNA-binding beta-propeller fold protein YncE
MRRASASVAACLAIVLGSAAAQAGDFTLFESGQVRPLARSSDGQLLFAVNTPDARLEVLQVTGNGLKSRDSIAVGLEPVAVAVRSPHEVWVVNHLSDSISVVALDARGHRGQVVRTLQVGDEPRDIVFAGPNGRYAFVTTAHRGQNTRRDPQLTTPGVGRADVWVFDANQLGTSFEGEPLAVLTLFTDTPRALAVSPDGSRVYAAGFLTGNQTTSLVETQIPDGYGADGAPGPSTNFQGIPAPEIGLIAKYDGAAWRDILGRDFSAFVRFNLPDKDVFVIDATQNPPALVAGEAGSFRGVGTVLYGMAVNPVSGVVYVANTDAQNHLRFEGPGAFAGEALHGRLHLNNISVLSEDGGVETRHLNPHIDYSSCCQPLPNAESEAALALPSALQVSGDGRTLYVAAMGSSKVGIFDTLELEADTFVPDPARQIELSGGGPTGLVLDEARQRLYVMTRFDNAVKVVNLRSRRETSAVRLHSAEPSHVVEGRRFLYDARTTSSHGDQACASCHVFGDFDALAWDLSNPDAEVQANPGPFTGPLFNPIVGQPVDPSHHPIKGPMSTQSLRGMANHGPMHWRGDRTGGLDAATAQPDGGSFDERAAFEKFQLGFVNLLRRDAPLDAEDMDAFASFILDVTYPPNPIRALDGSLTAEQAAGRDIFFNRPVSDGITECAGCHVTSAQGNLGFTDKPGFFGTNGASAFDFIPQVMKIPHLRNLYQKVGMFGMGPAGGILPGNNEPMGDQVRGFGFTHDGSFDTVFRFHNVLLFAQSEFFNPNGFPFGPEGDSMRRQVEAFLLAFDSNLAPVVGQQVTLGVNADAAAQTRLDLLENAARAGQCDLVVRLSSGNAERGYLYLNDGTFTPDRAARSTMTDSALRAMAARGSFITFTAVPPGSGYRLALDRDEDGILDGNDHDCD